MERLALVAAQREILRWGLAALPFTLAAAAFLRLRRAGARAGKGGRRPGPLLLLAAAVSLAIVPALKAVEGMLPSAGAGRRPNVIFIVVDTLRADHLGLYGYDRDTAPGLGALAGDATVFRNAYSTSPCTTPSMWEIMTSRYGAPVPAELSSVTMAEHFKSIGYGTGAFISQALLAGRDSNLHQGFDLYSVDEGRDRHGLATARAGSITAGAVEWMGGRREEPFFLWLVYFDPHDPYEAPEPVRGLYSGTAAFSGDRRGEKIHFNNEENTRISGEHRKFLVDSYDEEVKYFDGELEKLLAYLREEGLYDDTMIILTSDHGEELGDNGDLWDHCQLLSREETWVPLLIKEPGQAEQRNVDPPVQTIDIFPTMVEYPGAADPPPWRDLLQGRSLLPLMEGDGEGTDRFALSFWGPQMSFASGDARYWQWGKSGQVRDLATNSIVDDPVLKARLRRQAEEAAATYLAADSYYQEIDSRLRSLGYIK